jgi:hypothetical protein
MIYKKIIKYKMPGRHGDSDSQNAAEAGTFDTLRDEGEYFVHVKQYQKAIESFTKVSIFFK